MTLKANNMFTIYIRIEKQKYRLIRKSVYKNKVSFFIYSFVN